MHCTFLQEFPYNSYSLLDEKASAVNAVAMGRARAPAVWSAVGFPYHTTLVIGGGIFFRRLATKSGRKWLNKTKEKDVVGCWFL